MYVLLVGRQGWREESRCATTRHGGLFEVLPTGTSMMLLLCADIYTTQQTVSGEKKNVTVKPLNKRHSGDGPFVPCKKVVIFVGV